MGQDVGSTKQKSDPQLVGETSEVSITVNGVAVKALRDTGSCVSTCSEQFYSEYLKHLELKPLKDLLTIECVDGSELPYRGYVEVNILPAGISDAVEQASLLLVVPNMSYNGKTPVLLGTNVLEQFLIHCKDPPWATVFAES